MKPRMLGRGRLLALGLGALALDQASKAWAREVLPLWQPEPLGPITLMRVYNRGAIYGIFAGDPRIPIVVVPILILACVAALRARAFDDWTRLGLSLMIAASFSNWVDHVLFGAVTDFIPLGPGIANLADLFNGFGFIVFLASWARALKTTHRLA